MAGAGGDAVGQAERGGPCRATRRFLPGRWYTRLLKRSESILTGEGNLCYWPITVLYWSVIAAGSEGT